jgi:hypothetical protein
MAVDPKDIDHTVGDVVGGDASLLDELGNVHRSCQDKRRYSTEDLALSVAKKCFEARGDSLRVYPCTICGGFHLTSKNAAPMMREGWRPPAKSRRDLAYERDRHEQKRRGRRRR